jgi:hypothetical protein
MEFDCDSLTKFLVCVILFLTVESHAHASSENKGVILRHEIQMSERLKQKPSFSDGMKIKPDEASSISTTAQGISQVIDVFLIKKLLRFDLLICGEATPHIRDITNKLLSEIGKQTSTKVLHLPNLDNCKKHMLYNSVVMFTQNHKNLMIFNNYNNERDNPNKHRKLPTYYKVLIYVEEDATGISDFITPKLNLAHLKFMPLFAFEFLLLNERDTLKLKAVSYFTEGQCEDAKIKELNSMNKPSGKWSKNLDNFDYLTNLHGCLITFLQLLGPIFYADELKGLLADRMKFSERVPEMKKIIEAGNLTYRGVFYEIVEMVAKKANFTAYHQISFPTSRQMSIRESLVPQKGKILLSELEMQPLVVTKTFYNLQETTIHLKNPYASINYYFLVTPNDFYTNYEKLFFPFEKYAWMSFGLSFGLTFGAILLINRVQRRVRNVVFGIGIKNPTFNALSIFFGISQTKLPRENFARILLAMFLFLCLIFRTCYQSKMFEFMTTDMRKPPPASLEDLISMNYTVVLEKGDHMALALFGEMINGRVG